MSRTGVVTLLATLSFLIAAATAAGTVKTVTVVLGSKTSFGPYNKYGPYGKGWGTQRPPLLDNDGDPSGHAWNIRWTGWGTAVTRGSGLTYVLGAAYGSGFREVRLQLRASRVGRCYANGPVAYTRLEGRVAGLKHGKFGAWRMVVIERATEHLSPLVSRLWRRSRTLAQARSVPAVLPD